MELVARKADLVRELQFFQQIVERKNTIPILANVLIEATGNEITLLATDLEVTLRSRAEAAVSRHGGRRCRARTFRRSPSRRAWRKRRSRVRPWLR
jgi:DNA polymerase-3 subunit beta